MAAYPFTVPAAFPCCVCPCFTTEASTSLDETRRRGLFGPGISAVVWVCCTPEGDIQVQVDNFRYKRIGVGKENSRMLSEAQVLNEHNNGKQLWSTNLSALTPQHATQGSSTITGTNLTRSVTIGLESAHLSPSNFYYARSFRIITSTSQPLILLCTPVLGHRGLHNGSSLRGGHHRVTGARGTVTVLALDCTFCCPFAE